MLRRFKALFLAVLLIPLLVAPHQQVAAGPPILVFVDEAIEILFQGGKVVVRTVPKAIDPLIVSRITTTFDLHVVQSIDNIRLNGWAPLLDYSKNNLVEASKWTICAVLWNYDMSIHGDIGKYMDSVYRNQSTIYISTLDEPSKEMVVNGTLNYIASLLNQIASTSDPILQNEIARAAVEEFSACWHPDLSSPSAPAAILTPS